MKVVRGFAPDFVKTEDSDHAVGFNQPYYWSVQIVGHDTREGARYSVHPWFRWSEYERAYRAQAICTGLEKREDAETVANDFLDKQIIKPAFNDTSQWYV